jgi:hypothetical protein
MCPFLDKLDLDHFPVGHQVNLTKFPNHTLFSHSSTQPLAYISFNLADFSGHKMFDRRFIVFFLLDSSIGRSIKHLLEHRSPPDHCAIRVMAAGCA